MREAIAALRASFHRDGAAWHGPHALAVTDGTGRVVGMLSLGNLLSAVLIDKGPGRGYLAEGQNLGLVRHREAL